MSLNQIGLYIDRVFQGELFFEDFCNNATKLGVDRITNDLVRREHCFYGPKGDTYTHPYSFEPKFTISPHFDTEKLVASLKTTDNRQSTAIEFLAGAAEAGVASIHLFIPARKIIYMGLQGDFYIEIWA